MSWYSQAFEKPAQAQALPKPAGLHVHVYNPESSAQKTTNE